MQELEKVPWEARIPRLVFFLKYKHILKILDFDLKPGPQPLP